MKSNIYPVKITAKSEGIKNAETLLQEKRLQIGLSEPDTVQIKGGGYLILDFGREQSGVDRGFISRNAKLVLPV